MMTFARPLLLLFLFLPVILLVVSLVVANMRKKFALRVADTELLGSLISRRPSFHSLLPQISFLAAFSLVIVAAAGPQYEYRKPVEAATVVLAFDISVSMIADDVRPSRIEAAKEAAQYFIDSVPEHVRLGLVTFNQTVTPAVAPTLNREAVRVALDEAKIDYGTAMGDALNASVEMIKADFINNKTDASEASSAATIVVIGDGETTVGNTSRWGAEQARSANIPVSTIAFGTTDGIIYVDGQFLPAPASPADLEMVADLTGGKFFKTSNTSELGEIFDELGTTSGSELVYEELVWPWLVGAIVLFFAASLMTILFFRRLI